MPAIGDGEQPGGREGDGSPESRGKFAGLATALVVMAIYNITFINKYFPLTEGWFSAYANRVLHGQVPYRDFYHFLPPLYTLQIAAMIRIFGDSFLALRFLGLFVILGITGALYGLYSRVASAPVACLCAVFATMILQSFVASLSYDFFQFTIFYGLWAAVLLLKASEDADFDDAGRSGGRSVAWMAGAGVLGGLSFLTKQSNGLLLAAALGMAVVCVSMRLGPRRTIRNVSVYSLGFASPVAMILAWLAAEGALGAFFDQVLLKASQSKGGLQTILFGWMGTSYDWLRMGNGLQFSAAIVLIALAGWAQGWVAGRIRTRGTGTRLGRGEAASLELLVLMGASTLAVVVPYLLPALADPIRRSLVIERIQLFAIPWLVVVLTLASFFGSVFLCLARPGRGVRGRVWQVLIWTSLGVLFGAGTSVRNIGEGGMYFGAGLVLACLLEAFPSPRNVARLAFAGFALTTMTYMCANKYLYPYRWYGCVASDLRESVHRVYVRDSADRNQLPQLGGFRLPDHEVAILTEVKSIIDRNTGPGDPIFTFPHIPLFYVLSDRWPDTFSLVHWFDVTPDSVVVEDMKRLERNPPRVIVVLELPEESWTNHEMFFRAGRPLMQREMARLLEGMTSEPGAYTLEASRQLSDNHTLNVWVRNGRVAAR